MGRISLDSVSSADYALKGTLSLTKFAFALTFTVVALCTVVCSSQENHGETTSSNYNWKLATLGGTQYWTDVRVEGGWRVQRNSYFEHFRLLNDSNVRQAWGTEAACQELLNKHIHAGNVTLHRGKVVIVLHGLLRTWNSMEPVATHLESQGYQVILFRYASSREGVAEHAKHLKSVIDALSPDVTEINFVAHSLGNIVIRHYISDCENSAIGNVDPRIKRMVMIGPPNQGSRMARLLKNSTAFKLVAGASGNELATGWEELAKNLATPKFEFGIIAGGFGDDDSPWSNILLPGKDDFTVSERETMLVGARDFLVRPWLHSTIMREQEVLEATESFLDNGYFLSDTQRRPIKALPTRVGQRKNSLDR